MKPYFVTQPIEGIGIRDQLGDSGIPLGLVQAFEGAMFGRSVTMRSLTARADHDAAVDARSKIIVG